MKKLLNPNNLLLSLFFVILFFSTFLRFYNLNWGAPFYFHPDERNIASSITRLDITSSMNPEFFAYGSLPIYTVYFLGILENAVKVFPEFKSTHFNISFDQSIVILRSLSAVLSVLVVYIVFLLVKKELGIKYAVLSAGLLGFNVGLLQYSRFGTFEIWLTFLTLILFFFLYRYLNEKKLIQIIFVGIAFGFLLSVKVSSLIFLPLIIIIIFSKIIMRKKEFKNVGNYFKLLFYLLIVILSSIAIFLLTSPFTLLDFESFRGSITYESSVALGTLEVFYTGGFKNTLPIIYQLLFVYPFILNPLNVLLIILSIPFLLKKIIEDKNKLLGLSIIFFLLIFLSQAFFYVKWIRYYIPTIPFAIIIIVFGIENFSSFFKKKAKHIFSWTVFSLTIATSIFFSLLYFVTVQNKYDTRLEAYDFFKNNANSNSVIISEVFDLGIIPFNEKFNNITLFNFYELDDEWNKKTRQKELSELLARSDYLILPSQRIIRNRVLKPEDFPNGNNFYKSLKKHYLIFSTPCDIFCKILYLGSPVFGVEETASVFDRPSVFIYRINK